MFLIWEWEWLWTKKRRDKSECLLLGVSTRNRNIFPSKLFFYALCPHTPDAFPGAQLPELNSRPRLQSPPAIWPGLKNSNDITKGWCASWTASHLPRINTSPDKAFKISLKYQNLFTGLLVFFPTMYHQNIIKVLRDTPLKYCPTVPQQNRVKSFLYYMKYNYKKKQKKN